MTLAERLSSIEHELAYIRVKGDSIRNLHRIMRVLEIVDQLLSFGNDILEVRDEHPT